jgi:hypothetical protein
MALLFGVSVGVAGAAGLAAMWAFDVLLRHLHDSNSEEWLAAGKPCGFFFSPAGTNHWNGDRAMKSLQFKWLFRPPLWINEAEKTRRALFMMRCCFVVANLAFVSVAFILFLGFDR